MQPNTSANSGQIPPKAHIKTRPSDGDDMGIPVAPVMPSALVATPTPTEPVAPVSAPTPASAISQTPLATPVTPTAETPVTPEVVPPTSKPAEPIPATTESSGVAKKELTIAEKLEAARVAMEGPERSAERQQREKEQKVESASAELEKQKAKIEKEKEKLELDWIDWDNKRTALKKSLEPILAEETVIEDEEKKDELAEEQSALPEQKQNAEKKRQAIEDKRKEVEARKWVIQDKIKKIELEIEANTKKYQPLLDEEEKIIEKIEELKRELI